MASLIRAASERVGDSPRATPSFAPAPSAPAPSAPLPSSDASKTLKFVLSSLRARFKNSQGKLREIFREWDTDKSGSVDAEEMRVALHGMGFTAVQPDDAEQLIGAIDLGGDGEVQFEDFVRLLCPPKGETHAVTCSAADVARINVPVAPSAVNLPGRVFMLGGRAVKRVLGPTEAASLRQTSVGDAGNGVGSDPLKESVLAGVDAAEMTLRRVFSTGLGSAREGSDTVAAVVEEGGLAAAAGALAASGSPRPLAPLRIMARREESVELASLPPAEQHRVLTARGLLPPEPPRVARPDVTPSWQRTEVEAGPTMDELIAAAHATNRAGREFAERVARGEATMEDEAAHGSGGFRHGDIGVGGRGADVPALPERVSVPLSPLHLTARISARRAAPVPMLALPGVARGALAPAATTDWAHPLSYMAQTGRAGCEAAPAQPLLRAIVPAAVRPSAAEAALVSGRTLTSKGSGEGGDPLTQQVPPPGSIDRSLHATARLPPRREGLEGPLSSTGYEPVASGPEGGAGDTVVVGHIGGRASRSITAASRDALTPLDTGPFFASAAMRLVEGNVARLRLSARDVLALPLAGKPTVQHLNAPELPLSPLRAPAGGGSPRDARYADRRCAFMSARGEADGSGGGGGGVDFGSNATLSQVITGGRDLRTSRFGSMLGGGSGGGGGAPTEGGAVAAPASQNFSPEAHASHMVPGGSRLLAAAVREEGQRTTWLLSPPPSLHSEATPEHPSWHFASASRLAQTRTVVPEQEFARIAKREKHAGQRAVMASVAEATAQKNAADWAFSRADVASRIARKREERQVYKDAVMHRKQGQEMMLSLPFPVGEVQM